MNFMKAKLIQINTVSNGSIGRIMGEIQKQANMAGFETISYVGRRKIFRDLRCEKFGNGIAFWTHVAINTVFDKQGYGSYWVTRRLIKKIRKENPNIIHLHNIHGYYLHIPTLMKYLKNEYTGKLFWTFHDCWPFTGHCAYFTMIGCEKWKTGCYNCQNKKQYPISWFFDASKSNFFKKKEWFTGLDNLTIIVPSMWMKNLVKESFLKESKIEVVSNGIDLSVFKFTKNRNVRKIYGIPEKKKILLGVADVWSERKGLKDFLELSEKLSESYVIVLVGISTRLKKMLPSNIIGVLHTENVENLVELYSEASIFINPSREESFSVVTIEAMACGTPVIVLDSSAVKELVSERTGIVLHKPNVDDYLEAIQEIEKKNISRCEVAAYAQKYSVHEAMSQIIKLYQKSL